MVKWFRRSGRARSGSGAWKTFLVRAVAAVPFGAILMILAVGLFASVHAYLSAWAEGRSEFRFERVPIQIASLPDWAPRGLEKDLAPCVEPPKGTGLFTPGVLDRVRVQVASSPWVESVASVRALYPNRIEVDLILREPAAYVTDPTGGHILIDAAAVRLPDMRLPYRRNSLNLPRIDGGRPRAPSEGAGYADAAIREAASLAARLDKVEPPVRSLRIVSIDVRSFPSTGQIALWTGDGCCIQWGRISGDPSRPAPGRSARGTAALLEPVSEARKVEILRYWAVRSGFSGLASINVGVTPPIVKYKNETLGAIP